jgi:2,4-dienoyl-CoA reductase-like NADH-dependent reductase (Old Yellow Enzyme family)
MRVPLSSFAPGQPHLDNRVAVSPLCQHAAENRAATDRHPIHRSHLAPPGAAPQRAEASSVERGWDIAPDVAFAAALKTA